MKISFVKLKIEITEVKALDQMHKIDDVLNIKKNSIEKIRK